MTKGPGFGLRSTFCPHFPEQAFREQLAAPAAIFSFFFCFSFFFYFLSRTGPRGSYLARRLGLKKICGLFGTRDAIAFRQPRTECAVSLPLLTTRRKHFDSSVSVAQTLAYFECVGSMSAKQVFREQQN